MTPRRLDPETVEARLRLMRDLLDDLVALGPVPGQRLRDERLLRHAIERILTQLVELAAGINSHIVAVTLGHAPRTHRDSFTDAARAGVIKEELAAMLTPAVGMRNLLVHDYAAVDLDLVGEAVPRAIDDMGAYVRALAEWLAQQDPTR